MNSRGLIPIGHSECRKRQGFRGGRNFGLNAEHAAGTFLGKWNFFTGKRVIKRVLDYNRVHFAVLFEQSRVRRWDLHDSLESTALENKKTFWSIPSARYMHDIWRDQWIKVCERIVPSKRVRFLRHALVQILRNLRAYSNIFQSCQYWPVSVVSVNFDHRSVTLFRNERPLLANKYAPVLVWQYCTVSLVFRVSAKLVNFDCSVLITRMYMFPMLTKIYKEITLKE